MDNYVVPDSFMADGGSHFRNNEVDEFCLLHGIQHITTPSYAPWCNGLIEGLNRLLLSQLRRLCAPDMDAAVDDDTPYKVEDLPKKWPLHFDEAIRQINDRIRPNTHRSPHELLFGLALTPKHKSPLDFPPITPTNIIPTTEAVDENTAMADMLRMEAHLLQLEDAEQQKMAWDNHTPAVEFRIGDVIQWYDSNHDGDRKTINKLAPRWSTPHIIAGKSLNSYSLSNINGTAIPGIFASYRLRKYIPLRGSDLDAATLETTLHEHNPLRTDVEDVEERMLDDMGHTHTNEEGAT